MIFHERRECEIAAHFIGEPDVRVREGPQPLTEGVGQLFNVLGGARCHLEQGLQYREAVTDAMPQLVEEEGGALLFLLQPP